MRSKQVAVRSFLKRLSLANVRGVGILLSLAMVAHASTMAAERRAFTESDAIQMTVPGDPGYWAIPWRRDSIARFSPDRSNFVILVKAGDLTRNVNTYSLLLWRVADILKGSLLPRVLAQLSSSSNRPAIDNVRWAPGGDAVWFLGEGPGQEHQLYFVDVKTGRVATRTRHATSVLSFDVDAAASRIAYLAVHPAESIWTEEATRNGFVVPHRYLELPSLLMGLSIPGPQIEREERIGTDLFIQNEFGVRRAPLAGSLPYIPVGGGPGRVSISPDGYYVAVMTDTPMRDVPPEWHLYDDAILRAVIAAGAKGLYASLGDGRARDSSGLERYELVDTTTLQHRVLLDAPLRPLPGQERRILWNPDGGSVILNQTYLPLGAGAHHALPRPSTGAQTVEVSMTDGAITPIGAHCFAAVKWERTADELSCTTGPEAESEWYIKMLSRTDKKQGTDHSRGDDFAEPSLRTAPLARYRKLNGTWHEVGRDAAVSGALRVWEQEGMNEPPTVHVEDLKTHERHLLFDLNPAFNAIRFSRVQEVCWPWRKDQKLCGGLYYPLYYQPHKKYPLVIQTHGWTNQRFWPEGFATTGYAAQALASRDIFVLQLDETRTPAQYMGTAAMQELEDAASIYQSAIAHLSAIGLIDSVRVGVLGFSQTSYYDAWVLTRYPRMFAVASIGESSGGGYVTFLSRLRMGGDVKTQYGGPPVGRNLRAWVRRAPTFNLDRVRTPLKITVANPYYLLYEWELFEGLNLLAKPVDMTMLKTGEHILAKPSERMASSGGNVDWFDFWLNGHEDSDPAKAQQNQRLEKLCELQKASNPGQPASCVSSSSAH